MLFPVGDGKWDPHASYHRDGWLHQKSYHTAWLVSKRQPLDPAFRGTEQVVTTSITLHNVRALKYTYEPDAFHDVFLVPAALLQSGQCTIAVDVVDHTAKALWTPDSRIVEQELYQDRFPGLLVTLWDRA